MKRNIEDIILERFGDPIGNYTGDATGSMRSVKKEKYPECNTEDCSCNHTNEGEECKMCRFMETKGSCGCFHLKESKNPDCRKISVACARKKTARSGLKGNVF